MKLEKLFKKLESFINMDKNLQKVKKKEKLKTLLIEKINSKKNKITLTTSKEKKEKLKTELNMLKKISKKY